jgi:tetratricopeptide (TPR) repeat protein
LTATVSSAFSQLQSQPLEAVKPASIFSAPEIDAGFRELYELRFSNAREQFAIWKENHPEDPLGDVSIAASYLFEEFYRQSVLSSEFFLNDKRLLGGIEGKPDRDLAMKFNDANRRARDMAPQRSKIDSQDTRALYSLTLATGMDADYLGILERRHLDRLRLIKEAENYAKRLLKLQPDAQDAWLALGAADYIIGSLPARKRFFLIVGGIHGDRKSGVSELRRTAENGHYLKPYAKMLLGLVALRERQDEVAREEFTDLAGEFPENPIFASELERLNHQTLAVKNAR